MSAIYQITARNLIDGSTTVLTVERDDKQAALKESKRILKVEHGIVNFRVFDFSVKVNGYHTKTTQKKGAIMAKSFTIQLKDLSITAGETDKGIVVKNSGELGKILSLTKIQTLAEKYIGEKFTKGVKKSEACEKLFNAICEKVGDEPEEEVIGGDDQGPETNAPTKGKGGKSTKEKKPKELKEKKARKQSSYTFIAPGASVKADDIRDEKDKPLTPQGKQLFNIFFTGTKKGQTITLTKDEIIEKIEADDYKCNGNLWVNFMWYRRIFKVAGLME